MKTYLSKEIVLPREMSLEEIQQKIENGARFVHFEYCVSVFIAVCLRRFSKAYFIQSEEELKTFSKKYNRITSIIGWWAFPWGIHYSIQAVQVNKKGGHDITGDILLNLNEESLKTKIVELKLVHTLFAKPTKNYLDGFRKTLAVDFDKHSSIKEIYVGLFINVEEHKQPHHVIGFRSRMDYEMTIDALEISLNKEFKSFVPFEFVDLEDEDDFTQRLKNQGVKLL